MNPPTHSTSQPASQSEWLLIVDDESGICEFLKSGLESDTMEVVTVSSATAALQVLDQRKTAPLLVAMDVLMPGDLDGLSLARKLQDRLRRTKIVLMSGHLSDDSWWPTDLREVAFLAKPFRVGQLAELVAAAKTELRG